MERVTTEEVMDRLYIFQDRLGKVYGFGCWYLEIISEDAGTQFISTEFQEKLRTHGVCLTL